MCDDGEEKRGFVCRRCGCRHFNVVKTERREDGSIRRLRKCRHCGWPLKTIEAPESRRTGNEPLPQ